MGHFYQMIQLVMKRKNVELTVCQKQRMRVTCEPGGTKCRTCPYKISYIKLLDEVLFC